MKRLLYYSFRFVYIVKLWIRGRFTVGGLFVLAGVAASAVFGLDTNRTVAYQAFTFLSALLMVSLVSGIFFRSRFTARRRLPRFGTVGEAITYRVDIKNGGRKREYGLYLREKIDHIHPTFEEFLQTRQHVEEKRNPFDRAVGYNRWLSLAARKEGAQVEEQPLPTLFSGGEVEVQVEIKPSQRGHLRLKGLAIVRRDPFGLFKSIAHIALPGTILVLPKRYPIPALELPGTRRHQPGGVALASFMGDSEEFMSMRDYRPGDPLRHIHWKSWAKTGKPIVKEYQDEFFVRHALILDTFQKTEQHEIFEEAVSVAASFASSIQTQESLLDLMFVGTEAYCFTTGRGLGHLDNFLEILASVKACKDKPFSRLPPLVLERASLLSGCICILLSWDEERKQFIGHLRRLGIPLLALVITEGKRTQQPLDTGAIEGEAGKIHALEVGKIREGLAQI